jgi:hypothetical protein
MKRGLYVLWLFGCWTQARAQTFAEWFQQNKTRLEYYAQQIAALQTYIGYAEKGYGIVESGLSTIGGIKNGEFNLHNAFYSSLESINPAVGKMAEVAEVLALQAATITRLRDALSRYRQGGGLGADEVSLAGQLYQSVLNAVTQDVGTLVEVLTANNWQMTDDERMARVHSLDAEARERYQVVAGFTNQADLLSMQRGVQAAQVGTVDALYGLP